MDIAYITSFKVDIFPRPLFFKKAIPTLKIYQFNIKNMFNINKNIAKTKYENLYEVGRRGVKLDIIKRSDILRFAEPCYRQDRTYDGISILLENVLFQTFFRKIPQKNIIIKNVVGAIGAKRAGKNVIVDLMDLWHCDREYMIFNSLDFYALRKVKCVITWSKAIRAFLKNALPEQCIEYIPFGIDLDLMDPLRVSEKIFYEKYPHLMGKIIVGYSGAGGQYAGVDKLIKAFQIIEKDNRDEIYLAIQVWNDIDRVKKIIKEYNIKHYVIVPQTRLFNDKLRMAFLRASHVLVLTASRMPGVYLAERTTMYHYMSSGNAILAEDTPGVRGVLRHRETAYIVGFDDTIQMAKGIYTVISDATLRNRIGLNARRLLEEKYSWNSELRTRLQKLLEKAFQ